MAMCMQAAKGNKFKPKNTKLQRGVVASTTRSHIVCVNKGAPKREQPTNMHVHGIGGGGGGGGSGKHIDDRIQDCLIY